MHIRLVAKTALFNEDGNILILTRSETDVIRPGAADFPGGGIETGEDILAGAVREIEEETGIIIASQDLSIVYTKTSEPNDDGHVLVRILCTASVTGVPEIALSYEHSAYRWCSFDDTLSEFDDISWAEGLLFGKQHGLLL